MNLNDYKLLTHKGCMDGSSTAIAFLIAGGKIENIIFTNPNHDEADDKLRDIIEAGYSNIVVADCSISYDFAKEIDVAYKNLNIVLLDHHKTAIPLTEFKWCHIDKENTASGAMMLYDYLKKQGCYDFCKQDSEAWDRFFSYVDDHDRWCKNYPESEELAILHGIIGQKIFIERFSIVRNNFDVLNDEEKFLIKIEKNKIAEMIEDKKREVKDFIVVKNIKGRDYRFGFIGGAAKFTSQIADALYSDPALNLDVVVLVSAVAISLRCKKGSEVDLSELAKLNLGGGHRAASGFPLTSLLGKSLVEFVCENMRLE